MNKAIAHLAVVTCLTSVTATGQVLYVDDDARPGGDGGSWATAYRFLQDALAGAARSGGAVTEVRVGQGLQRPDRDDASPDGTGDREATFQLVDGVAVNGGYAGLSAGKGEDPDERDPGQYVTVLSGDLLVDDGPGFENVGENSHHVVTALNTGATTALDGFTVTAGNADPPGFFDQMGGGLLNIGSTAAISRCRFVANSAGTERFGGGGAGMANCQSSPALSQCVFEGNSAASDGGGLLSYDDSLPVLVACEFIQNEARFGGGASGGGVFEGCTFEDNFASHSGGGLEATFSEAELDGCLFASNLAFLGGGAVNGPATFRGCTFRQNAAGFSGGALNGGGMLTGCSFLQNLAGSNGGGLALSDGTTLVDCVFDTNAADAGGAVYDVLHELIATGCTFSSNTASEGGGLIALGAPVILSDCHFDRNDATRGGAILLNEGAGADVTDCTFSDNEGLFGAALAVEEAGSLVVTGCELIGNRAGIQGGGVFADVSTLVVVESEFRANIATGQCVPIQCGWGGGAHVRGIDATFVSCGFLGNVARVAGAGLYNESGDPAISNCLFAGNDCSFGDGGGLFSVDGSPVVSQCTFSANAALSGSAMRVEDGAATIRNSVVWGNEGDRIAAGAALVQFSCVEGGYEGPGNVDADPGFLAEPAPGPDGDWGTADDDYGDLRLSRGSPCLDAGHDWLAPPDAADLDADRDLSEFIPFDLDGNARFSADGNDVDPGCGVPVVVDMGAYEHGRDQGTVVFGDLDGDGTVGVDDLVELVLDWGPCDGCCLGDLDVNGVVDVSDLVALILLWG